MEKLVIRYALRQTHDSCELRTEVSGKPVGEIYYLNRAKEVVRAVNAHDALVAALEVARNTMTLVDGHADSVTISVIDAALKLAQPQVSNENPEK